MCFGDGDGRGAAMVFFMSCGGVLFVLRDLGGVLCVWVCPLGMFSFSVFFVAHDFGCLTVFLWGICVGSLGMGRLLHWVWNALGWVRPRGVGVKKGFKKNKKKMAPQPPAHNSPNENDVLPQQQKIKINWKT